MLSEAENKEKEKATCSEQSGKQGSEVLLRLPPGLWWASGKTPLPSGGSIKLMKINPRSIGSHSGTFHLLGDIFLLFPLLSIKTHSQEGSDENIDIGCK